MSDKEPSMSIQMAKASPRNQKTSHRDKKAASKSFANPLDVMLACHPENVRS
jgi:hypothetical protein